MTATSWAAIAVAIISALGAWAAQRSAKSASTVSEKTKAETEAYIRARDMDVKTIERQDKEIETLREDVDNLTNDNRRLHAENVALRRRVDSLENHMGD